MVTTNSLRKNKKNKTKAKAKSYLPNGKLEWIMTGGFAVVMLFAVVNAYFYYSIPHYTYTTPQDDPIFASAIAIPSPIVTELKVTNSTQTIAFTFKATNTANATLKNFQCSIDFSPFEECTSPVKLPLKTLGEGEHTFEVRAVDTAGRIEEQPAVHILQ